MRQLFCRCHQAWSQTTRSPCTDSPPRGSSSKGSRVPSCTCSKRHAGLLQTTCYKLKFSFCDTQKLLCCRLSFGCRWLQTPARSQTRIWARWAPFEAPCDNHRSCRMRPSWQGVSLDRKASCQFTDNHVECHAWSVDP